MIPSLRLISAPRINRTLERLMEFDHDEEIPHPRLNPGQLNLNLLPLFSQQLLALAMWKVTAQRI